MLDKDTFWLKQKQFTSAPGRAEKKQKSLLSLENVFSLTLKDHMVRLQVEKFPW